MSQTQTFRGRWCNCNLLQDEDGHPIKHFIKSLRESGLHYYRESQLRHSKQPAKNLGVPIASMKNRNLPIAKSVNQNDRQQRTGIDFLIKLGYRIGQREESALEDELEAAGDDRSMQDDAASDGTERSRLTALPEPDDMELDADDHCELGEDEDKAERLALFLRLEGFNTEDDHGETNDDEEHVGSLANFDYKESMFSVYQYLLPVLSN